MSKIRLGKLNQNAGTFADGEVVYLEQHKWDCGWYWGFGYLGNRNCHFHFDNLLNTSKLASELFADTTISDRNWWIIRDLFKQAYALKAAAEVYKYGGHQTSAAGVTDILKNAEKAAALNADLKRVLDAVWTFVQQAVAPAEEYRNAA